MKRSTIFAAAIAATLSLPSIAQNPAEIDGAVDAAKKAASAWLAVVDKQEFARSYDDLAPAAKSMVPRADWESNLKQVRGTLGALQSREVNTAQYSRSLPGAPDGEYVVIQYRSRFDKSATATETVTPMRGQDGAWRVSGYFVR